MPQAENWSTPHRVVFKADVLAKGPNTRFVVTNRTDSPLSLCDGYVQRGEAEHWIKSLP